MVVRLEYRVQPGQVSSIVALHRSSVLGQKQPGISSTTYDVFQYFSEAICDEKLRTTDSRLNSSRLADQLEVDAIDTVGERLYRAEFGFPQIATQEMIRRFVFEAADMVKLHGFSRGFLLDEWTNVIDAWQLRSWESYRDVRRHGRKIRLSVERRSNALAHFRTGKFRTSFSGSSNAGRFIQFTGRKD